MAKMSPKEFLKKLSKEDKKALNDLSKPKNFDFIPSGSWVLNSIIGDGTNQQKPGGLPRGYLIEIFGNESSGKTTCALSACKQAQAISDSPVIFLDFERSFHHPYAEALGVDLNPERLMVFEPDHFEHGWSLIKDALIMEPPLIVCDSVTAMIPKQYLDGSVDESGRIGAHAALMSRMLNEMTKRIKETNTSFLMLNQIRAKINTSGGKNYGPSEDSTGGNALKFYASVRIKLKKGQAQTVTGKSIITGKSEKKAVNVIVYATAVKNRIDAPFKTGPLYIRFGKGFDNILSMIELATNTGVIKKKGAFYSFETGGKTLFNAQGKEKLREVLMNDAKIYSKLKDSLVVKEDSEAKELYQEESDAEMFEDVGNTEDSGDTEK